MYERLTLKERGSVPTFIQAIVGRVQGSVATDFFKRFSDGIISAALLPPSVRLRNQCEYVEGESRWCSELLTDLASFITGSARLHCHAAGAEAMGFDRRDIRAIHAVAIRTIMVHLQYRRSIMARTTRLSSSKTKETYECYDQFQDYLENKGRSRDRVRKATAGYVLIPPQPLVAPTVRGAEPEYPTVIVGGAVPTPSALLNYPVQAHNSLVMLNNQGNETMTLGVPVSPFNFNRPAIEEIKFVYGISVKELTLQRVTALLTERQQEVDRLKDLPHKPEVIKAQITKLKGEIKEILALANELFPVDEAE